MVFESLIDSSLKRKTSSKDRGSLDRPVSSAYASGWVSLLLRQG